MNSWIINGSRPHRDEIMDISRSDTAVLLTSTFLMCVLCWHAGFPLIAIALSLSISASEWVVTQIASGKAPLRFEDRDAALLAVFWLACLNSFLYSIPAILLALNPSVALKLSSVFWLLGMNFYIANTWSRIPPFLFGIMASPLLVFVFTFALLPTTAPVASPMWHWVAATGLLVVYIYIAIEALQRHYALERNLYHTQAEANQHLSRLEDSRRIDTLTGLLNRPAFDKALSILLDDRTSSGTDVAVFMVDLDSFKPINDTYSHEAGDEVLIQTAQRLSALVDMSGIVARLGGDEFIIALPDVVTPADAIAFAEQISAEIALPIRWNNIVLRTTASIGIAMTGTTNDGPLPEVSALCSAADQAMFAAKTSPSRTPKFFRKKEFASRMTKSEKQDLIESINERRIKPYYQPKVRLSTGEIIGFEALARWEHKDGTLHAPSHFLDQITDIGLQGDFMIQMAHQILEDVGRMCDADLDPGQVSLNVPEVALATYTGRQELHHIIADRAKLAKHLTFEITEDVFIARAAETIQTSIASFRSLGVRISLDDFGTGFASFHHLRLLDFDELKIDQSFIAGLGHDPSAKVLVNGFLNIASGLGLSVIAEGVETEDQRRDLINMGCICAQGY
ncbi:MAG: EAL domain-containing protein, partial [Octadecabacter sp.]|nr:EAL domain-containing protein [Octadecabacter sp.]